MPLCCVLGTRCVTPKSLSGPWDSHPVPPVMSGWGVASDQDPSHKTWDCELQLDPHHTISLGSVSWCGPLVPVLRQRECGAMGPVLHFCPPPPTFPGGWGELCSPTAHNCLIHLQSFAQQLSISTGGGGGGGGGLDPKGGGFGPKVGGGGGGGGAGRGWLALSFARGLWHPEAVLAQRVPGPRLFWNVTKWNERGLAPPSPLPPRVSQNVQIKLCKRKEFADHFSRTTPWTSGEVGFPFPGGGSIEPPKAGERACSGKRAQLTGPLVRYCELWRRRRRNIF